MSDPELRVSAEDRPLIITDPAPRRSVLPYLLVALLALGTGGGYYLWRMREPPTPPPEPVAQPAPAPAAPTEPRIEHPIDVAPASPPLPALAESDPALGTALAGAMGKATFEQFFVPEGLVRHLVATIDNLPRKQVAARLMPVKPVPGPLRTTGQEATLAIAPDNAARYTPYVQVVNLVDSKKLVAVYTQFYPLFQQSYAELGYPSRYFNDRVFEVIDHLLATPDVSGSIALTQPKVLYEFADPQLQDLSAGQKIMVRMGTDNEARVKVKLREIRKLLQRQ
jgi:Protein of unknown function (DUF3014)